METADGNSPRRHMLTCCVLCALPADLSVRFDIDYETLVAGGAAVRRFEGIRN